MSSITPVYYLRPLVEHVAEVSKAHAPRKLSKNLPKELFGVYGGPPRSVVLLLARSSSVRVEGRSSVRIVLFPLHLIAQHLQKTNQLAELNHNTDRSPLNY